MPFRRPARAPVHRPLLPALACAAALLAGCGSGPAPTQPPLVPSTRPPAAAPVAGPASAVAPVPVAPASAPVAPPAVSPLETPALAARFPDPAVTFDLPSLQPGGSGSTSAADLDARLRAIAATPPAAPSDAPTSIAVVTAGKSQDSAPLQGLVFTRHPAATPAVIVRGERPTVLLVAQQHGDEPAGAEALLVVAQSLASGPLQDVLDRINVVILPRANPDGAGRNQAVTTLGVDLDTDHLLLATPEARAMALVARDYQPLVFADLREYPVDPAYAERLGGAARADLMLQYAGSSGVSEFVTKAAEAWFRQPLLAALRDQGLATEWLHRPVEARRAAMDSARADNARNVNGLRNAVSFTLATRGANLGPVHLSRRVFTHVEAVTALLRSSAQRADDLVKLRKYVDASVRANLCKGDMAIDGRLSPVEHTVTVVDPAGGTDREVAITLDSSLALREARVRTRPCGYWLAADQGEAVSRLRGLGVRVEKLVEAIDMQADVNTGAPVPGEREILEFGAPAGSFYVPLSQPWGNLAVAALEPDSSPGLLAAKVVTAPNKLRKITSNPKVRRTLVP